MSTTAADAPTATTTDRLWDLAGRWRGAGIAVGILALTRVVQLLLLVGLDRATAEPTGLRANLLIWDGGWFLRVAQGYPEGYTYGPTGALEGNELAFFPLYPSLIRVLSALGFNAGSSALAVSWLASVGAAVALHLLGTSLFRSRRAGWALVGICCGAPMSVVLSMAYTESLFLALLAGMLVAAHRKVWWAAGLLGLGCALTRPTGAAAAVALAVAALLAVRAGDRKWPPLLAAGVALAGVPAYLGWVGWRVGEWDAWFKIQTAGWGTSTDFGRSTVSFLADTLTLADGWVPMSVALILLAALAAAGVALVGRPWLPLGVYGVVAMVLVYGQAGYYHSKPRLLLPVLLTLLPAVAAAARARPRVAILAISAWALFGLWYGAYLVAVWPYTI
ncbi:glycosyltransferase family protein [Actinoplanes sp. RD1]|uniref:hypothetical protein n=1 Tax=Actinoplanes sp. RD1 TaxID=3064538 RepID=UPI00274043F9|nr:hypothetical protein [Actinoplanes sp. RD1]